MKKYKQLDLYQRYKIEILLEQGYNQTQIAYRIGVHKSTVSRELKRNTPLRGRYAFQYSCERAQDKADKRERTKPRKRSFTYDQVVYIGEKMRNERWSPELISARGRMEFGEFISHEWIYQYIWSAKHSNHKQYEQDRDLHTYLGHYGRGRKRRNSKDNRGCIPNRIGIEHRPSVIEQRSRYGDYEVDFMMGKDRKPGLIVLTDRTTLLTRLIKTHTKNAKVVAQKIIARMKGESSRLKTQTYDNDMGFASHQQIAKALGIDSYFTRPYTAQDKGTVENRIGVIRRFIPKGTDVQKIHHSTIKSIERKINNRPVRKFNYLTPQEKYYSLVAVDT